MRLADVGPEAALTAALPSAGQHGHGCVVRPQHRRLKDQLFLALIERSQQLRGCLDPLALGAAGDVQSVTCEDVFLSVERKNFKPLACIAFVDVRSSSPDRPANG